MLGQRDDLEISPFVSAWSSGLDGITTPRHSLSGFFGRDFAEATAKGDGSSVQGLLVDAFKSLATSGQSQDIFKRLEREMIAALVDCLEFADDKVDYLTPLFTLGGDRPARIATLNYDTTLETAAGRAGIDLDTGIERWSGGLRWDWRNDAEVQLLKLHGSVDWLEEPIGPADGWQPFRSRRYVNRASLERSWFNPEQLGVVFGQRGKLRANGPFLAMLVEFEEFLRTTDRLVIVGYSFRDDHINEVIGQWIAASPDPRLTLVDPVFRDFTPARRFDSDFLNMLTWILAEGPVPEATQVNDKHVVLGMGAREALPTLAPRRGAS